MSNRGITILELLVSIVLVGIVSLLLLRVVFVLDNINNNDDYASKDEIERAEIIKSIESDFLKLKLQGIKINKKGNETVINFSFQDEERELVVSANEIKYAGIIHKLNSKNASYSLCPKYEFLEIDTNYYLVSLTIPVLIKGENTKEFDDIILTYLNLKSENLSYPSNYSC